VHPPVPARGAAPLVLASLDLVPIDQFAGAVRSTDCGPLVSFSRQSLPVYISHCALLI
jgi:hypothetical protein